MAPTEEKKSKRQPGKDKLRSIMEAASALTALGDEDSTTSDGRSPSDDETNVAEPYSAIVAAGKPRKRYIPDHKKPDAALTFPEKLMNMMQFADKQEEEFCIAWLPDGKSFVIRNPDEFTRKVLPSFFKATKFSSFTRKLYRWGFRQVNRGIGPDDPIVFGNEYFQRDDAQLMAKMSSVTAASTRKAEAFEVQTGVKRPLESGQEADERDQKRVLLDRLIQQKAAAILSPQTPNFFGLGNPGASVSLAAAINPRMSLGLTSPFASALPALLAAKQQDMLGQRNPLLAGVSTQISGAASTAEIVNAAICALRFAS